MYRDDQRASVAHDDRAGVEISSSERSGWLALKRVFDVVVSLAALPIIIPFFAMIAVLVRLRVGGPVFYVHKRVGKNGREFGCIKLRTMVVNADLALERHLANNPDAKEEWERTQKLLNDPRILPGVGKLLRNTSLDELPQLFNVLKGEMSLVGPRPVTREELKRYGEDSKYYKAVRPGITGKWQVGGRNETSYEERVRLDVDYVQNWSFLGDLVVLAKTVVVVLKQDGAA